MKNLLGRVREAIDPVLAERQSHPLRNGAILIALVAFFFVAAVFHIPLLPRGGEVIRAEFVNSSQVHFNAKAPRTEVRVGGVKVGKVESLDPGRTPRTSIVTMRLNEEIEDFSVRRDARADIRWRTFLGGEMYIDLKPGSSQTPRLKDTVIPATRTSNQQEVDDLLQLYDGGTEQAQRGAFKGLAEGFSDPPSAGRAIETTSPTLRTVERGARYARGREADDLRVLVAATGKTVEGLGRDRTALQALVEEGNRTLAVTNANREDLGEVLDESPSTLDSTSTTMRRIRSTLDHLDPLAARLRPGARAIAPAARAARPTLVETEALLRQSQPLLRSAGPTFDALGNASEAGVPLLRGLDPTLRRLDSELLPFLRERDERTQLRLFEALGPTFSSIDHLGSEFDRIGFRSRVTVPFQAGRSGMNPTREDPEAERGGPASRSGENSPARTSGGKSR